MGSESSSDPSSFPTAITGTPALIAELRAVSGKRTRKPIERALSRLPDCEVVPALINALHGERKSGPFRILSRLLADRGGEDAVHELARQARVNRQFPLLSIHALSRCNHPYRVDALIERMRNGSERQWLTAVDALARLRDVRAIEPLCRAVGALDARRKRHAHAALRRMGRSDELAMRALSDATLSDLDCTRAILAMDELPVYVFPLSFTQFNGERFLGRISARENGMGARAETVLTRMREQRTLLRPASPPVRSLLRASYGGRRTDPEEMLRPSDLNVKVPTGRARRFWSRLVRRRGPQRSDRSLG